MDNVAAGLGTVLTLILNMVQLLVIASVVISWVGADPYNPIVQAVTRITEPMYRPFRRLTSRFNSPIDFAPIFVILIVIFVQRAFVAPLGR